MKSKLHIDFWLLVPVAVLITISLATLLSVNFGYFRTQSFSLVIGILSYLFFSQTNIDFIKQFKIPIYIMSLILFGIVLFIGIETRGASRWIDIFGVRLQFSEILKPFLALSFASLIEDLQEINFTSFIKIIILMIPIVVLIALQPDLGSGLLYIGAGMFALIVIGFPFLWFGLLSLPIILVSPLIWTILHGYQKQRILTFINANPDPLGTSYNSIQAIIAVGSGGFLGKGISEGTQSVLKFLPERHTDFIFATIAEGLGFVGSSIVIIAFLLLVYRIYILFRENEEIFNRAFLAVAFGFILIQGFVNIAMNMGILPIVGITFPFVSFGGSSLLSNFIFLGMISSITGNSRNKGVLEIR
ncbi:MAG TPA: FtsW/RodA/SpoVE family cell cycle protein [Candidatus Limnocylindrales bacterium]|nr:FtsW/RodA/SpoVE family cell cycle protein [Candidatus Limnocylindrales bacterium]